MSKGTSMTDREALKLALEALKYRGGSTWLKHGVAVEAIEEALAQPAQEAASIIQAVTDPENQPSQYGTVTLDYHLAKLKEWEDRFERISDLALAQPEQEPVCDKDPQGCWNVRCQLGKKCKNTAPPVAQPEERNFCPRCGKRTADLTTIHTCTPPQIDQNNKGVTWTQKHNQAPQLFAAMPSNILPPQENT